MLIYEGKGKKLYKANEEGCVLAEFKDDLTAFNALKKGEQKGKGELNCLISQALFTLLEDKGIATHYIKLIENHIMLCRKMKMIPLEVVVRNIATGSLSQRLGIEEGKTLPFAIVEFYYKDDALGDPLLNDDHCLILGAVQNKEVLETLRELGKSINRILSEYFIQRDLVLVDFKLEFGFDERGEIILGDELSPDNLRLWDKHTGKKLDKDVFRQDLGDVKSAYEEVLYRIRGGKQ
ncbi:phosphoribosylaminoimidazolesuccinocarboxamide synthase [Helicobacter cholecystus]|uniref:Phosphoribosylaminoimidazole-succinocarboxamide synthase n=1 Tax=Helicobacter cholecystus TaxID=45498 RepID=A0A3D8IVH1_9HELI|nr:phosphoribosylaminoimidazolesuccinocarboxamide synthase [Helicobacter cholecystus]RDU68634.1 phosphoribosylaminoimidazolesuccinocarboxamide synthase [Helicobacter cholecystus]VEJ24426.1 phosphoribosylaminoimidazole-succinocarboxamide synthase [Helicobacter cholecystus]